MNPRVSLEIHRNFRNHFGVYDVDHELAATQMDKKKEEVTTAPNFGLSGALAKDTNTFKGVVIKYNEPPEAHKPDQRWFLYPFKKDESLEPIPIYRQSAFMLGRDRTIADIPIDHPSCSKQHSVIQFRKVKGSIHPYIIDLDSANKTKLNDDIIEPRRYYQLFEKDVLKFGFSTREYVMMHENCAEET